MSTVQSILLANKETKNEREIFYDILFINNICNILLYTKIVRKSKFQNDLFINSGEKINSITPYNFYPYNFYQE